MRSAPFVDGRRFERFFEELRAMAPHYTPDFSLSDGNAGVALMRIFAQLAELVAVRLDRAPDKHFVAFLDRLGILPLPARPARAAVAFKLADGLLTPVTVPAGTRVTAPGTDDEIPFETITSLVALPGTLAKVYGADPTKDEIFRPPPGFLIQQPHAASALEYVVRSFAAAGADRLQLDHLTELQPGAYVRIACSEKHVIRALDDGNIVLLEQPLARDVSEGTFVTPIRDFEVFNGINVQEHVLYIGHAGALTVKEQAEITLTLTLNKPSATPLNIAWQFWTKDEDVKPAQEEHWHDLTLQADGTQGMSASGDVVLVKPGKLEVKARAVAATESRWIRAKLLDKLTGSPEALPRIDAIAIRAKSLGAEQPGIPADQGFYNATPLDVQVDPEVGFLPFGPEPRLFDQFYVASKEAFTKEAATVTLDFALDLQPLASPALAMVPTATGGEMRAYSIGLRRRLYQLRPDDFEVISLGDPSKTPIAGRAEGSRFLPVEQSIPSAIPGTVNDQVGVFVVAADALRELPTRLWLFRSTSPKPWVDLASPVDLLGNTKAIQFSPAAIRLAGGGPLARVFVVDVDGNLHSRTVVNLVPNVEGWQLHGAPQQVQLKSSPWVVLDGATRAPVVYVTGILTTQDGPRRVVCQYSTASSTWRVLDPQPDDAFEAFSRPFAQSFTRGGVSGARVLVVGYIDGIAGRSWALFECDTTRATLVWRDLGLPDTGGPITGFDDELDKERPDICAPSGFVEDPLAQDESRGKHILLRGPDNRLYERVDDNAIDNWRARQLPGDLGVVGSPATLTLANGTDTTALQVFAATNRNSLARVKLELISGTSPAEPTSRVALLGAGTPAATTPAYDGTRVEVEHDNDPTEELDIDLSDTSARLVRTTDAFDTLPTSSSTIRILKNNTATHTAQGRAGADRAVVLRAGFVVPQGEDPNTSVAGPAEYVRIGATMLAAELFSPRTGVVLLSDPPPAGIQNKKFTIARLIESATTEFKGIEELDVVPELSWEYWNGRGWLSLKVKQDTTRDLLSSGKVVFDVPRSLEATEVAGQENFWIRARLVGGDYGRETFTVDQGSGKVTSDKTELRPPNVSVLRISYDAKPEPPEACITFNNLAYVDQTAAAQLKGALFAPFERLEDPRVTLFLGFEHPFKSGPVQLLLDAAEREVNPGNPPSFAWTFRRDHAWHDLSAEDGSVALTQQGILMLSASDELTRDTLFGDSLFWVKGTLREPRGSRTADYPLPLLRGLFINTTWATHGETITEEIAGSSTGDEHQTLKLQHGNVLEHEDIRVQEALSVEEAQRLQRDLGPDAVTVREDIGGTWVRWQETRAFFDAAPDDRVYRIDRAAGILHFGDGRHGRIPPAGVDNIRAFTYRTGGGSNGNLAAGAINTLATSVAGVESVFNPTSTGGGSDTADTQAMLTIGPRQISHRDRAVSPEDFEHLAYEASRQVAKARCLAATNLARSGSGQPDPCDPANRHVARDARGFVSLIIVPHSRDPQPCPSLALRRTVADFLRERAPSLLVAGNRLVVRPPDYVVVDLTAHVIIESLEKAADVEKQAVEALRTFLHPLDGGPESGGWDFGRALAASDVFAVLERIKDVDRVEELELTVAGVTRADGVPVGPNELLACGDVRVRIN